ncbi:MAG: hypothetical protein Fur0018_06280 [Anaerolineales bacterium]
MSPSRLIRIAFFVIALLTAGYAGYLHGSRVPPQERRPVVHTAPTAAPVTLTPMEGDIRVLWLVYDGSTLRSAWAMTYLSNIAPYNNVAFTPVYPFAPLQDGVWQPMQTWATALQRIPDGMPDPASLAKFIAALGLESLDGIEILDIRTVSKMLATLPGGAPVDFPAPQRVEDLTNRTEYIHALCNAFIQAPAAAQIILRAEIKEHLSPWPGGSQADRMAFVNLPGTEPLVCTFPLVLP